MMKEKPDSNPSEMSRVEISERDITFIIAYTDWLIMVKTIRFDNSLEDALAN